MKKMLIQTSYFLNYSNNYLYQAKNGNYINSVNNKYLN